MMECFEQENMSNELLMQTLKNMGKNLTDYQNQENIIF